MELTYTYNPRGVLIQGKSGTLYTTGQWNNQEVPNGVAVITDSHRFVIAKEDIGTKAIYNSRWENPNLEISDMNDLNGYSNTQTMIGAYGDDSTYAAGACVNYSFPNGKNGYLGAVGEWKIIMANIDEINFALDLIGGSKFSGNYWTSTLISDYDSQYWFCQYNSTMNQVEGAGTQLSDAFYTRAFTTL